MQEGYWHVYISYVAENSGYIALHKDLLYLWNDNAQLQVTALALHMHSVFWFKLGCYRNNS